MDLKILQEQLLEMGTDLAAKLSLYPVNQNSSYMQINLLPALYVSLLDLLP